MPGLGARSHQRTRGSHRTAQSRCGTCATTSRTGLLVMSRTRNTRQCSGRRACVRRARVQVVPDGPPWMGWAAPALGHVGDRHRTRKLEGEGCTVGQTHEDHVRRGLGDTGPDMIRCRGRGDPFPSAHGRGGEAHRADHPEGRPHAVLCGWGRRHTHSCRPDTRRHGRSLCHHTIQEGAEAETDLLRGDRRGQSCGVRYHGLYVRRHGRRRDCNLFRKGDGPGGSLL